MLYEKLSGIILDHAVKIVTVCSSFQKKEELMHIETQQNDNMLPEDTRNYSSYSSYSDKSETFLMRPTVDFCFKELMADPVVRKGFIAAILGKRTEEVKDTTLLPTILRKGTKEEKLGILDVRILMSDGEQIDMEMQVGPYEFWEERTLFYMSKIYIDQINAGDSYGDLGKCIHIGILDFIIYQDTNDFYSIFNIWEDGRKALYSDKFEFHVLELPKLERIELQDSELLYWAKFFGGKSKEDFESMAEKNEYINTAYERLKNISADDRKRFEYEAREKAIRDHNHLMFTARKRGIEEGIEQGLQRGLKASVHICRKLGMSQEDTKKLLVLNFNLSLADADEEVLKYWSEEEKN